MLSILNALVIRNIPFVVESMSHTELIIMFERKLNNHDITALYPALVYDDITTMLTSDGYTYIFVKKGQNDA